MLQSPVKEWGFFFVQKSEAPIHTTPVGAASASWH
jgi:hypothetical protein